MDLTDAQKTALVRIADNNDNNGLGSAKPEKALKISRNTTRALEKMGLIYLDWWGNMNGRDWFAHRLTPAGQRYRLTPAGQRAARRARSPRARARSRKAEYTEE